MFWKIASPLLFLLTTYLFADAIIDNEPSVWWLWATVVNCFMWFGFTLWDWGILRKGKA